LNENIFLNNNRYQVVERFLYNYSKFIKYILWIMLIEESFFFIIYKFQYKITRCCIQLLIKLLEFWLKPTNHQLFVFNNQLNINISILILIWVHNNLFKIDLLMKINKRIKEKNSLTPKHQWLHWVQNCLKTTFFENKVNCV
jgi:hypothetical protein